MSPRDPVGTAAPTPDEAQTRAACDPAIEPWVLRNGPMCDCDAWGYLCNQGRQCPHRPAPAEAATEIGAQAKDDDVTDRILAGMARVAGAVVGVVVFGLVVAGVVAQTLQWLP